ncbi:MAG: hypothetical protein ACLTWM_07340 [Collinsella bouchesdurhonensis]
MTLLGMLDYVVTDEHLADFAVVPRPFTCKHVCLAVLGGVTGDVEPCL